MKHIYTNKLSNNLVHQRLKITKAIIEMFQLIGIQIKIQNILPLCGL